MYIENIVIGTPLVEPYELIADSKEHFESDIISKTYFTEERFLPKILVDCEIMKSTSEVKRNRPDLFIELINLDCLDIKIGKRKLYIIVGE